MGYWSGYPRYVSVAEKRAKAARKLAQLKKKNPNIKPVVITGRMIAKTWWGKSWNVNLERYADYSNRIGRGRSYVRNGMVLDLQIRPGKVTALVQGTGSQPYSVTITIGEISKQTWKNIREECQGKFDSLAELMEGKFPKALQDLFIAKGQGLFPSPKEIRFSCSCPDWASMCKHVAATLYGISARLDENPMLFFKLRKANVNDLISEAVAEKTEKLLKKAGKKSARVIEDADMGDMFGIEMDYPPDEAEKSVSGPVRKKAEQKRKVRKTKQAAKKNPKSSSARSVKTKSPAAKKRPSAKSVKTKSPAAKKRQSVRPVRIKSPAELVEGFVMRSRKGIDFVTLEKKTGAGTRIIYNTVYRLFRQGKIVRVERGVYKKRT